MALSRFSRIRSSRGPALLLLLLVALASALWTAPSARVDTVPFSEPPIAIAATQPNVDQAEAAAAASDKDPIDPVAPSAESVTAPYRASATQRAEDQRRAASEPDLPGFADELVARANAGDADAAWALSGIYAVCAEALVLAGVDEELSNQLRTLLNAGFSEDELPIFERVAVDLMQRCSGFSGAEALVGRANSWSARALALGHPVARLQQERPRVNLQSPQMREFEHRQRLAGLEVLQQGDPLDLARHAHRLYIHSPFDPDAFALAACTLVPACAADPGAFTLAQIQSQPFVDHGVAFTILRDLSPRRRMITQGQSAEIIRLWRARRFDDLLGGRPQSGIPGGG